MWIASTFDFEMIGFLVIRAKEWSSCVFFYKILSLVGIEIFSKEWFGQFNEFYLLFEWKIRSIMSYYGNCSL